ncbi:MAG TPA: acetyl-CoA carboxylase biotin carboxylase subunit [Chitinophagaceae bacterium]|nr:acetyl-CoA carboxylase biotin carboxylase subunit [Chitinophagaceae bacterium]
MFKKILVANRGEIALRIMRSAREMGISTLAVFSEADRKMPFVQFADEGFCIGAGESSQSYLSGDRIIRAALDLKADAIHPGYGFLSEDAAFASQVAGAGLVFIGPSAPSIAMMGNKLAARKAARELGVPLVPGTGSALRSLKEARETMDRIGLPVLIKAAAGGGGKGIRIVSSAADLEDQLRLAVSEAKNAFGDDAVYLEKYIHSPRHIEIQILGDQHGHLVHLFERECSIQRRHQKLIEESPSCNLTAESRQKMGKCATDIARASGYYGAGTIEFLVDDELRYYFLEMNTRLQVEHPVTELVTGLDLVKEQIRIAAGEKLSVIQDDIHLHGHAIELRICAEDPTRNFLPQTGKLEIYRRPHGPGIRVDDGYDQGLEIPIHYDSLLSKLIAWGRNREEAIERMVRAIDEYEISGIPTTLGFGKWAMRQTAFAGGHYDTRFIEKYYLPEALASPDPLTEKIAALLGVKIREEENKGYFREPVNADLHSKWKNRRQKR